MTDEARKALMEFLGEPVKTFYAEAEWRQLTQHEKDFNMSLIRTFTTAQDMVDLARAISKHGKKWGQFEHYIETAWMHDTSYDDTYEAEWLLIDPERFCQLVYDSEVWR